MQSKIKSLFDDDSGVSPVIGVILMVAITVILAAVIASFVLGLGDQTDDVSPNIVFESDGDASAFNITVESADSGVDAGNIQVISDGGVDDTWDNLGGDSELSAGDSITLSTNVNSGGEVRIVFETEDTTDTLDTFEVP